MLSFSVMTMAVVPTTTQGGTHTLIVKNDLTEPKTIYYMYTTYRGPGTEPNNFADHRASVTVLPGEERTIDIPLSDSVVGIDASRLGPPPIERSLRSGVCYMGTFGDVFDEPARPGIKSSRIKLRISNYVTNCHSEILAIEYE